MSVRSADEARAALAGGATVIDIKEPDRGPLGRADFEIWGAVRRALPPTTLVSVALGELREWDGVEGPGPEPFAGLAYRKIGLSGAGPAWVERWADLRRRWGQGPPWVSVAYADWERAEAPHPNHVLDIALRAADCAGILVDTWDKSRPSPVDHSWHSWFARARDGGRLIALAGGLDAPALARLAPLGPDLFAVRGAACLGGGRRAPIDLDRVAHLARTVRQTTMA